MSNPNMQKLRCHAYNVFRNLPEEGNLIHTAEKHLKRPLWGPVLKCYWNLRMKDFSKYWSSRFSSQTPLNSSYCVVNQMNLSNRLLPLPLLAVYRTTIGEWRRNREQQTLKKGVKRISVTNLGNLSKKISD
jgi:hypothetical protein